jgi:hypothetical protein
MILSKNADVKAITVKAIEGKPMYGGDLLVKPLIKGDEMTFWKTPTRLASARRCTCISTNPSPTSTRARTRRPSQRRIYLGPATSAANPKASPWGEGIEESIVDEIKSPAPIYSFLEVNQQQNFQRSYVHGRQMQNI